MIYGYNKSKKQKPELVPEVLFTRGAKGLEPTMLALRNTLSGHIVRAFELDDPALRKALPKADAYRLHRLQEEVIGITGLRENKYLLRWDNFSKAQKIGTDTLVKAMVKTAPTLTPVDDFRHNPELSIRPLRYDTHFGKKKTVMQGYALVDDKTGKVLRYLPDEYMQRHFIELGAHRLRVGKYGNITSLVTENGESIGEKQLIDRIVGVDRAYRPVRRSRAPMVAGAAGMALMAISGMSDTPRPDNALSNTFNERTTPRSEVKVIPRAPDADPYSAYKSLHNKALQNTVSHWFLNGTYKKLVDQYGQNNNALLEAEDAQEITKLEADNKRLDYKMMWPVQAARGVDEMWAKDESSLKMLGFRSASHLYRYALAFAHRESFFGNELSNPLNPTVSGFYHFNTGTFRQTLKNYQKEKYGADLDLPSSDEDLRAMMNDPRLSTKMLIQHMKDNYLGRSNDPNEFYLDHVLGAGGARLACDIGDNPANRRMAAAAADNPGVFYEDGGKGRARTGREVLRELSARLKQSVDAVDEMGFTDDTSAEPLKIAMKKKYLFAEVQSPRKKSNPGPEKHDRLASASVLAAPTEKSIIIPAASSLNRRFSQTQAPEAPTPHSADIALGSREAANTPVLQPALN